jgi:hypothetical protein
MVSGVYKYVLQFVPYAVKFEFFKNAKSFV